MPMPRGAKHSKETKKKMSKARKGKLNWMAGKKHTEKTKQKNREKHLGKKHSEETKRKMSEARQRFYKNGGIAGMKGRKSSEETKKKMSEDRQGEKNSNWIDGRSFLPYPTIFNQALKNKIRKRDNYACQKCGKLEREELDEVGRRLTIHHIDYNKMNCIEKNLITLCIRCNAEVNASRNYWIKFFEKKLLSIINTEI